MANLVARSDRFLTERDFAVTDDYIYGMMESVQLLPNPSIDAEIADYWSPQSAVDEWESAVYEVEYREYYCKCWGDYIDRLVKEQNLSPIDEYNARQALELDLAFFVATHDTATLCRFLQKAGYQAPR